RERLGDRCGPGLWGGRSLALFTYEGNSNDLRVAGSGGEDSGDHPLFPWVQGLPGPISLYLPGMSGGFLIPEGVLGVPLVMGWREEAVSGCLV
uniref:Uncharacterized protein n=1 Tax=Ficedula albicollis TaxID=59894 RepID=A0A803V806_FICAL